MLDVASQGCMRLQEGAHVDGKLRGGRSRAVMRASKLSSEVDLSSLVGIASVDISSPAGPINDNGDCSRPCPCVRDAGYDANVVAGRAV